MSQGHAPNINGIAKNEEERAAIRKQMESPFPSLLLGYVTAEYLPGTVMKTLGYKANTPVICRVFCMNPEGDEWGADMQSPLTLDAREKADLIVKELNQIGCDISWGFHHPKDSNKTQVVFSMPCIKKEEIPSQGSNPYYRPITETGLFLAYLIHRKYVSKEEVRKAFGTAFLQEAEDAEIAKRIRSLDKEKSPGQVALDETNAFRSRFYEKFGHDDGGIELS